MNITKSINYQISEMKPGKLFSCRDIPEHTEHGAAVARALSRKAKSAEIVRVKKGLFYKPEKGMFGSMTPRKPDIIKYFTLDKNKTVGYLTGTSLFHLWGLTTQVPAEMTIATSKKNLEKANISGLRISTIPAKTKVTKDNVEVLQFLDILNNIDRVSDASSEEVFRKLASKIKIHNVVEINKLEQFAIEAYAPKTKALLGAFLETYLNYYSELLHKALSPTSKYKISISHTTIKNKNDWHIVSK